MTTPTGEASVALEYDKGRMVPIAKHAGAWALLKLLRDADAWRDQAGGGYQATWTAPGPTGAPVSVTMVVTLGDGPAVMRPEVLGGSVRCVPVVAQ
jgi:type VI protein secretion system component VasK